MHESSAAVVAEHVTKVTSQPVISIASNRNLNCRLNTKQNSLAGGTALQITCHHSTEMLE